MLLDYASLSARFLKLPPRSDSNFILSLYLHLSHFLHISLSTFLQSMFLSLSFSLSSSLSHPISLSPISLSLPISLSISLFLSLSLFLPISLSLSNSTCIYRYSKHLYSEVLEKETGLSTGENQYNFLHMENRMFFLHMNHKDKYRWRVYICNLIDE
jgi:hypothetical protein